MVKTQISHPTSSPLISGFDWHSPPPPRLFLMLLAVSVSLCDNWEPATLSMFATASRNLLFFILPSFSLLLSLSQDEGPQHLISTSAVKVQRLLALLHIMKEGWSLDPAGNLLKDWVTERGIPELFLFLFFSFFANASFSLFCFGVCGRRFFAETNFLLLFFKHDGEKKKLYKLIMLKACILTKDKHKCRQIINQTHTNKDATLKKRKI